MLRERRNNKEARADDEPCRQRIPSARHESTSVLNFGQFLSKNAQAYNNYPSAEETQTKREEEPITY